MPSRPTGPLEIRNVTHNSVDLAWKPPQKDGGKPVTSYIIEYRVLSRSFWSKAGTVEGKTTTFTANNLMEDTDYMLRVTAVNDEGQSPPLESDESTKPVKKISKFAKKLKFLFIIQFLYFSFLFSIFFSFCITLQQLHILNKLSCRSSWSAYLLPCYKNWC